MSKFDFVLHYTARRMPDGWQDLVKTELSGISDVVLDVYGDIAEIACFHKRIKLESKLTAGSVSKGDGDWKAGLLLLRLEKYLPITIVDDGSNPVDRRSLKSLFLSLGYQFHNDEFDGFATELGLMQKVDDSIRQAIAQSFI